MNFAKLAKLVPAVDPEDLIEDGPAPDVGADDVGDVERLSRPGLSAFSRHEDGPDDDGPRRAPPPSGASGQSGRDAGSETIECSLTSNVFRSKDGKFQVFKARDGRRFFEFKSNWPVALKAGETVRAEGHWKDERTFWANRYEILKPQSTLGVRRWLGGGAVLGVGARSADKIAEKYGADSHLYLGDPVALVAAGLTPKQAQDVADAYLANKPDHDLSSKLLGYNLGYSQVAEIMDTYGLSAMDVIEANPWRLASIDGISFQHADRIAQQLGRRDTDPLRLSAGMEYALKLAIDRDGHSGIVLPQFEERVARVLAVERLVIQKAVPAFLNRDDVVIEGGIVSRKVDRQVEMMVAYDVARIARSATCHDVSIVRAAVAEAEAATGIVLDESQREAAVVSLASPFSVITGGPGVGKSTTLKVVVEALSRLEEVPRLAAPTGRASKRMTEVSGLPSSTIHRLLKFDAKSRNGFTFHRRNPLQPGRYIIDESSMTDIRLTRSFLQAVPDGSRVILVGDVDQLPSVGPGQVLRDIIASGVVAVSRLTKFHRQAEDSGILRAAYAVNAGRHLEPVKGDNGFHYIAPDDDKGLLAKVVTLVSQTLKERGFDPRTEVQVLAAMRERGIGVDLLNQAIKKAVNPGEEGDGRSVLHAGRTFTVGDRVLHTKNRHKIGIYNGDVGYVAEVALEDKTRRVVVEYADQVVTYTHQQIHDIEHCYATTIHKSQGSEYAAVVVLMPQTHQSPILNRNLLYTALTRAKKLCFLVADEQTVRETIDNVRTAMRTTSLARDLKREFDVPSLLSDIEDRPEDEDDDYEDDVAPAVERAQREEPSDQGDELEVEHGPASVPEHSSDYQPAQRSLEFSMGF